MSWLLGLGLSTAGDRRLLTRQRESAPGSGGVSPLRRAYEKWVASVPACWGPAGLLPVKYIQLGRAVNNYTTSDPRTEISTFYLAPTARENVSSQVRPKRSFLIDFAKPSSLQTHISKATQDLIVLRLS